jgi:hypothetical protein
MAGSELVGRRSFIILIVGRRMHSVAIGIFRGGEERGDPLLKFRIPSSHDCYRVQKDLDLRRGDQSFENHHRKVR